MSDVSAVSDSAVTAHPKRSWDVLLACGIISSVLYVATDVLASMRWEGYQYLHRMASDLFAVGSPTRSFILAPMTVYNILVIAFGIGVWLSATGKRSLRVAGSLLVAYGVLSWVGLVVFPLRPESSTAAAAGPPLSSIAHATLTFGLVVLMFLFIGFGAAGLGKWFRVYSVATILVVLAGGGLAFAQVQRIAAGLSTPWLGLTERTNIYATLLWVVVFAIALMRANAARVPSATAATGSSGGPKKVTVLLGSPHKGGATYTASRKFLDYLEAYGDIEGEIVPLGEYDIGTCRGCKVCFERGEERCPLKDDRDVIIHKMLDSDGVIFASPNYSWGVSGLMKVFLDRIGFVFHRPRFWGKTASSIVVQGMFRGAKIRDYLEFVAGGLGFKIVKGSVTRTLEPMTEEAIRKMDLALAKQSERFHAELVRDPYPTPSLFKLGMFRMGRSGIRAYAPRDKRDYAFYAEQGWFESDYYYPTHLGPVKKALGALFDWLGTNTSAFKVAETVPATQQSRPSSPAVQ